MQAAQMGPSKITMMEDMEAARAQSYNMGAAASN